MIAVSLEMSDEPTFEIVPHLIKHFMMKIS